MRFPTGYSNQDFLTNWYNATPFGTPTSYGFHEADDLNKNTGGDTDLGQPLYAVLDGEIVYFHNNSHPTKNFGRHMVLKCQTSQGVRWFHYAHCKEITAETKTVKEGDMIGRLGKSGTTAAHLHFACFKVDPSTLYLGIDSIAKKMHDLVFCWESPIAFLTSLQQGGTMPNDTLTVKKSDWERLLKASQLGDRFLNGFGVSGNIADKDERLIDEEIRRWNEISSSNVQKGVRISELEEDLKQCQNSTPQPGNPTPTPGFGELMFIHSDKEKNITGYTYKPLNV